MKKSAVVAAVKHTVDRTGGKLLMLVNDLAKSASFRSGGGSEVGLAATEEEVRMRYLAIQLEAFIDEVLAVLPFDLEEKTVDDPS